MKKVSYKALTNSKTKLKTGSSRLKNSAYDRTDSLKLKKHYDENFVVTKNYRDSLPDVMQQNDLISGSRVKIQQVGIANFKSKLKMQISENLTENITADITGTVSLAAHTKGINMSRILRTFFKYKNKKFNIDNLTEILNSFKSDLDSESARLKISFNFPLAVKSLRSNLLAEQFYEAAIEAAIDRDGKIRRFMEFSFVYSSACPCSSELAEHARQSRGVYSIPHSQRSKAKLRLELNDKRSLTFKQLRDCCHSALKTETQVLVKREDEQAFAELNAANEKFVEDAVRLLFEKLDQDKRVKDFEISCVHYESLHSHDAVSVICKGIKGGMKADQLFC